MRADSRVLRTVTRALEPTAVVVVAAVFFDEVVGASSEREETCGGGGRQAQVRVWGIKEVFAAGAGS